MGICKTKIFKRKLVIKINKEENIVLINDDCLKAMDNIPDKSIDCIITDLPYG